MVVAGAVSVVVVVVGGGGGEAAVGGVADGVGTGGGLGERRWSGG